MNFTKLITCTAIYLLFAGYAAFAGCADLTQDKVDALNKGKQVYCAEDVHGSAWPKVFIYQLIHATPEESAALMMDYEYQKSWAPGLKKSKISKKIDPRTVEVDYTIDIPIFSDESYTARDVVSSYDVTAGKAYRIDWTMVRADATKSFEGFAKFEPFQTETLFSYYSFVVPGQSFAGLVKDKATKRVKETCSIFGQLVEKQKTSDPVRMQKEIDELRLALK